MSGYAIEIMQPEVVFDFGKGYAGHVPFGTKQTGVDGGTAGDVSVDDDYLYVCVVTGGVGVAIWKKSVLFKT